MKAFLIAILAMLTLNLAQAGELDNIIAMRDKGAATFYVEVHLEGVGNLDFLVDTGSSYTTINEKTLTILKEKGQATYVRSLAGTLADGTRKIVPIYSIAAIHIGNECYIDNVEAAVFPGNTRHILGLSALRKAAPFIFSIDPPSLALSNCDTEQASSQTAQVDPLTLPIP